MKNILIYLFVSIFIIGLSCIGIDKKSKSKFSFNPVICKDTCFGDFSVVGSKRIGKTLNVYITGFGIDLSKDCCRFSYGEIIHNYVPEDTSLRIIKFHLIDLDSLEIINDTLEYSNETIKKKVMCISIDKKDSTGIKTIYDPYDYGIYKKIKE
jgi:hypothetical protein